MATVNPYITYNGNCEDAFNHYRNVFGGEFVQVSRFSEMPPEEGAPALSEEEGKKIMHISLPISEQTILMGSDVGGPWAEHFNRGNNISLSISTDGNDKADDYFSGLSEGGEVTMPMADTFWGSYFGMCTDRFGIAWMISADKPHR